MSGCPEPIGDNALLGWWAGDLGAGQRQLGQRQLGQRQLGQRQLEQHLLGCAECSSRLAVMQQIAEGVRRLLRQGELPAAVGPAVVDQLRREGLRIREYAVPAGGGVQCTVSPEDDLLLARLGVDLRQVSRLDLVSRIDDGAPQRLSDLPFDPGAGELLLVPPVSLIRGRPTHVERMELIDVTPDGGERLLGRYAFHHTRWGEPPR